MPSFRVNRGVDPSQISGAIGSLADAFKPLSAQELYAGAKAQQTRQQSDYLAEAYRLAQDPNASQDLRDRIGSIAGAFTPAQSLTAIDRNNANALALTQAQQAGETARNANTVRGSTIVGLYKPMAPGEARSAVPGEVMGTVGLPPVSAAFGTPKPLTKAEAEGAAFGRLPEDQQLDAAYGSTPVEQIIRNGMPEIQARRRVLGATPAPTAAAPTDLERMQAARQNLLSSGVAPDDRRVLELTEAINAKGRGAVPDPYGTATGAAQAKRHADLVKGADSSSATLANLDALGPLLENAPTGALADQRLKAAKFAREFGLGDVADGLMNGKVGQAEASNAITERLINSMHVPGTGTQSDRDLASFRAASPSLRNTPEGNRLIMSTMRAMAEHQQQAGEIARQAQARQIDPAEADRRIAALPSPFAAFRERMGASAPAGGGASAPAAPAGRVTDGAAAGGGLTLAHIAALRANPGRTAEFDAKFGPGAAATILGAR